EKVSPHHYEGWDVAPDHIAYNHSGYVIDMPKTALASNLKEEEFSVINTLSNKTVLQKQIDSKETRIGTFQYMDFSEVEKDGSYIIKAGDKETKPFKIGSFEDVYRNTVIKTINHYYSQRCGFAVPGIHDVCHVDWTSVHNDKTIPINGG